MNLKIIDYKKERDKELLDLFYKSVFYKRKEFEYARIPNKWITRYELQGESIQKIAIKGNKAIASLGGIIFTGNIGSGKQEKICYFVDNCILPEYHAEFNEIFGLLFDELEKDAKKKGAKAIYGWDYETNLEKNPLFFKEKKFKTIKGFCWYPAGGGDLNWTYPIRPTKKISLIWKILMKAMELNQAIKKRMLKSLPANIIIEKIKPKDLKAVCEIINKKSPMLFAPKYSEHSMKEMFKNKNFHGIIARENEKICCILLYFVGAWAGWMFGKPGYEKKWTPFFVYTPFEFEVQKRFEEIVPAHMIFELMKIRDPEKNIKHDKSFTFFVDAFDERIKWRENAAFTTGCEKVKYDFGAMLIKPLYEDINLENYKTIFFPTLFTIAPVPKAAEIKI